MMTRYHTLAGALLLLALADGASAQRSRRSDDDYRSRIDTTFAFSKNGSVSLNLPEGEIIVHGWDEARVQVKATSDGDNIRIDATSSRLTLETAGGGRGDDTRFEVTVPYGVKVSAHARSGDVSVRGTKGEVEVGSQSGDIVVADVERRLEVSSLSGDVQAEHVNGDVEIHSVSGDSRLSGVNGDVEVESVSGDITIAGAVAKVVRAHTTSGDVSYDGTIDPQGRYDLAAHSGDIDISIPEGSGAQLTVSTWSGSVESDFPITLQPGEHGIGSAMAKRFTFQVGNGAARITLESFSGDININSRGGRPRR